MKRIGLLLLLTTLLLACSKDKRVKRKLHFGSGKWEIVEYKRFFWSPNTVSGPNTFVCAQCGTIEFKRNGTGSISMSDPQASGGYTFSYSTTGDELTLFTDDGGLVYDITWDVNRKQMTLSQNIGHIGYVNVITCKKK
ncbi:hypothetical protein D3C87_94470 [compost metagenome]